MRLCIGIKGSYLGAIGSTLDIVIGPVMLERQVLWPSFAPCLAELKRKLPRAAAGTRNREGGTGSQGATAEASILISIWSHVPDIAIVSLHLKYTWKMNL